MNNFRLDHVSEDMINPSSPAITHQFLMRKWHDIPLQKVSRTIIIIVDPSFEIRNERRGRRAPHIGGSTKIRLAKGFARNHRS